MNNGTAILRARLQRRQTWHPTGRVTSISSDTIRVAGVQHAAHIGQQVSVLLSKGQTTEGEVIQVQEGFTLVMLHGTTEQIALGARVVLTDEDTGIAPCEDWIGRVVDPLGRPLDGQPLMFGSEDRAIHATPPCAAHRAALGDRMNTGLAAFNTFLPIVEGQRLGLFSGSGVGKSSLLAALCHGMEADIIVMAMIGERGRELRHFVQETLGEEGMRRAIIVAATSDQSALLRRRCALSALSVAEHFRAQGKRVLFLADSVTRFAEAHREIALAAGELPALRGYPPSTSKLIMSLCERAGPGAAGEGSITAIFSVLVAGSDFDEPIADILRGVLDGHVILDRDIAERGRFPAINLLKSVSRSLPQAATEEENSSLKDARSLMAAYENAQAMIRTGLYVAGSDPLIDRAVRVWADLDAFVAKTGEPDVASSFRKLNLILRRSGSG